MKVKTCTCCKQEYPLNEFYKFKRASRGKTYVTPTCKLCSIQKTKDNREFKEEYYTEYFKKYFARPDIQAKKKAYESSEKRKASKRLQYRFWRIDKERVAEKLRKQRAKYKLDMLDPVKREKKLQQARTAYYKRKEKLEAENERNRHSTQTQTNLQEMPRV